MTELVTPPPPPPVQPVDIGEFYDSDEEYDDANSDSDADGGNSDSESITYERTPRPWPTALTITRGELDEDQAGYWRHRTLIADDVVHDATTGECGFADTWPAAKQTGGALTIPLERTETHNRPIEYWRMVIDRMPIVWLEMSPRVAAGAHHRLAHVDRRWYKIILGFEHGQPMRRFHVQLTPFSPERKQVGWDSRPFLGGVTNAYSKLASGRVMLLVGASRTLGIGYSLMPAHWVESQVLNTPVGGYVVPAECVVRTPERSYVCSVGPTRFSVYEGPEESVDEMRALVGQVTRSMPAPLFALTSPIDRVFEHAGGMPEAFLVGIRRRPEWIEWLRTMTAWLVERALVFFGTLPPYVLLEVLDHLPGMDLERHFDKIAAIDGAYNSIRMAIRARTNRRSRNKHE